MQENCAGRLSGVDATVEASTGQNSRHDAPSSIFRENDRSAPVLGLESQALH